MHADMHMCVHTYRTGIQLWDMVKKKKKKIASEAEHLKWI